MSAKKPVVAKKATVKKATTKKATTKRVAVKKAATPKKTAKAKAPVAAPWSIADALADERLQPSVRRALGNQNRFRTPRRVRTIMSHRYDVPVIFCVNNPDDRIHMRQTKGFFYEEDELAMMAEHMPKGGTFCDIGANVGNHSLYMLLKGGAGRVVPVEPNPDAISLLLSNMILNRVADRVALETLGYGLDEGAADDLAIHAPRENLGWARLKKAGEGDEAISVRAGDELFDGMQIDVLKMDVEGMEIGALKGLKATLARCKPTMFIEVDKENLDAFHALIEEFDYEVAHAFEATRVNQNFLLKPKAN
ncbi:methyltransferase, FkbM family [Octadecabacter temperatus]|uniref:Methyltransferase domain protein n=1 Tax=Octadecabacter temperatus TaxID=1458307 RepID=A0A0K0Y4V0_9RHOB|nr:Methyltransferase domain protein [Octadecabacter temperatus]SIO03101.1 methyltransferase, FkbM family [Octadecabacter temperatus]